MPKAKPKAKPQPEPNPVTEPAPTEQPPLTVAVGTAPCGCPPAEPAANVSDKPSLTEVDAQLYTDPGHHCLILEGAGLNPFAVKLCLIKYKQVNATQAESMLSNVPLVAFKGLDATQADTIMAELEAAGATVHQADRQYVAHLVVNEIRQDHTIDRLNQEVTDLRRKLVTAQRDHRIEPAPRQVDVFQSKVFDLWDLSQRDQYHAQLAQCHQHGWPIQAAQALGTVVADHTIRSLYLLTWIETQPADTQPVNQTTTAKTGAGTGQPLSEEDPIDQADEPAAAQARPIILSVTAVNHDIGQSRLVRRESTIPSTTVGTAPRGCPSVSISHPKQGNDPFQQHREDLAAQRDHTMIPFRQALDRYRKFRPSPLGGSTA